MQIKAGTKLYSAVCNTQIMVLRVPADDLDVTCGGLPMHTEEVAEVSLMSDDAGEGSLVGKRYVDEAETMEFLCTRGGEGSIAVNGFALEIKQAKRLPSSD